MRLSTYSTDVYMCPSACATPDYPGRAASGPRRGVGQPESAQCAAARRRTAVTSWPGRLSGCMLHWHRRRLSWLASPAFGDSRAVLGGG